MKSFGLGWLALFPRSSCTKWNITWWIFEGNLNRYTNETSRNEPRALYLFHWSYQVSWSDLRNLKEFRNSYLHAKLTPQADQSTPSFVNPRNTFGIQHNRSIKNHYWWNLCSQFSKFPFVLACSTFVETDGSFICWILIEKSRWPIGTFCCCSTAAFVFNSQSWSRF